MAWLNSLIAILIVTFTCCLLAVIGLRLVKKHDRIDLVGTDTAFRRLNRQIFLN
jgi:hypothetical protein